jgi:hypothetical protein
MILSLPGASRLNRVQHASTGCPYLLETEVRENRALSVCATILPWAQGGRAFKSPRPDQKSIRPRPLPLTQNNMGSAAR